MQFAVSCNDREIFKLVYSFCSVATETITNIESNNNNNSILSGSSKNRNSQQGGYKNDHDTASMTSISKHNPISDFGPATIFKTDENGKYFNGNDDKYDGSNII